MSETNLPSIRILVVIAAPEKIGTAIQLFQDTNIPIQYQTTAIGTASNEIIDALGLGSIDKSILIGVVPKTSADRTLVKLRKAMKLYTPNSGIAFTIPMTSSSSHILRMLNAFSKNESSLSARRDIMNGNENIYTLVAAIVNQGFSEEVMLAAKAAGARGGTVIRSRSIPNEKSVSFWGLNVQEEKEIVLIVTELSHKIAMMKAISEKCGIHSNAKGSVMSIPIDSVAGIDDDN